MAGAMSMDRFIEHVLENDGTRYLPFPIEMTPIQMREHAHEALASDVVQVTFVDRVDQDRRETVFERDA
jgi:hypothetical protein